MTDPKNLIKWAADADDDCCFLGTDWHKKANYFLSNVEKSDIEIIEEYLSEKNAEIEIWSSSGPIGEALSAKMLLEIAKSKNQLNSIIDDEREGKY